MMRMPFGRHKGLPLDQLEDSYLEWLLSLSDLREPLRSAIVSEGHRRGLIDEGAFRDGTSLPTRAILEEIITAGQRALAKKYHPDSGNNNGEAKMAAVNVAADLLRRLIEELSRRT